MPLIDRYSLAGQTVRLTIGSHEQETAEDAGHFRRTVTDGKMGKVDIGIRPILFLFAVILAGGSAIKKPYGAFAMLS